MTALEGIAFLDLSHKYLLSVSYIGLGSLEPSAHMSWAQTPSRGRAMVSTEIQCDWCVSLCGKKEWCVREDFQMDIKDNWNARGHAPSKEKTPEPKRRGTDVEGQVRLDRYTDFRFWSTLNVRWGSHRTSRVTWTCGSLPIMSRNNTKFHLTFSQWFPWMGTLIPLLCFIPKVGCRIIYFW